MPVRATDKYMLPVDVSGFRGVLSFLNGRDELAVEGWRLVWSAVMVGYPGYYHLMAPPGSEQWWACMHRVSIVRAFLEGTRDGYLRHSSAFRDTDPSEKTAINYYLGMTAAKLVADRLLKVRILQHYDGFYMKLYGKPSTGTRPDLIGMNKRRWFAIEAKGRQRGGANVIANAVRQACGFDPQVAPALPIASVAYVRDRHWIVTWRVPEMAAADGMKDGDSQRALVAYYAPIVDAWHQLRQRPDTGLHELTTTWSGRQRYEAVELPNTDVHIALSDELIEAVDSGFRSVPAPWAWLKSWSDPDLLSLGPQTNVDGTGRTWHVGPDGVGIGLGASWVPEVTREGAAQ
jgi:hypothetical protein